LAPGENPCDSVIIKLPRKEKIKMKRLLTPEQLVKLAKDMNTQEENDKDMEHGELMLTFTLKPKKPCTALFEYLNGILSVPGAKGITQFFDAWRFVHAPDREEILIALELDNDFPIY
jgi:hypothetical protein